MDRRRFEREIFATLCDKNRKIEIDSFIEDEEMDDDEIKSGFTVGLLNWGEHLDRCIAPLNIVVFYYKKHTRLSLSINSALLFKKSDMDDVIFYIQGMQVTSNWQWVVTSLGTSERYVLPGSEPKFYKPGLCSLYGRYLTLLRPNADASDMKPIIEYSVRNAYEDMQQLEGKFRREIVDGSPYL